MAGFALIFRRDGAHAPAARLHELAARLAYRGPQVATWTDGAIALAQIGARTYQTAPKVAASMSGWRAVFDGRLDNRRDLAAALSAGPVAADGSDDAELLLGACERWGSDGPARLVGDFAGAVWNSRDREVWLMRDVRSLRPLYYRLSSDELTCASDLRALALDGPREINEGMVAECLTGEPVRHRETLYQGIVRLPMAHLAVIGAAGAREWIYWLPQPEAGLDRQQPEDRAARLTQLLDQAIDDRLAGAVPAALLLSGGLDSSSIGARLAGRAGLSWHAFTLGHARAEDDERAFASQVATHLHAPHTVVEARTVTEDDLITEIQSTLDLPPPPNGIHGIQLRHAVSEAGYASALSGLGSDEWLTGSYLSYADLVRRGSWLELMRSVWADRDRDETTRMRLQLAAWALCPPPIQRAMRVVLGRTPVPPWIPAAFANRTGLADRMRTRDIPVPDLPRLSQQATYREVTSGSYVYLMEMQERANARAGTEERYPFHDRRLSEFCLGLPESDLWSRGSYKTILRRAMNGRLPAFVLERQMSPNADRVLRDMLQALGGERFFSSLSIAERGWIDGPVVLAMWRQAERRAGAGTIISRPFWALWAIAAVELWARHAGTPSPASTTGGHSLVS